MARYAFGEFEEAQAAGPVEAERLYQIGLQYAIGSGGVEQDNVTAHKWLNIAAMRGCARARSEREALAMEMSKDEIAAAQREAREWLGRLN